MAAPESLLYIEVTVVYRVVALWRWSLMEVPLYSLSIQCLWFDLLEIMLYCIIIGQTVNSSFIRGVDLLD